MNSTTLTSKRPYHDPRANTGILPLLSFWSRRFTSKTISEKDDMLVRERSSVDDALTETAKVARRNTLRPVGERRRLPCYNRSILLRQVLYDAIVAVQLWAGRRLCPARARQARTAPAGSLYVAADRQALRSWCSRREMKARASGGTRGMCPCFIVVGVPCRPLGPLLRLPRNLR